MAKKAKICGEKLKATTAIPNNEVWKTSDANLSNQWCQLSKYYSVHKQNWVKLMLTILMPLSGRSKFFDSEEYFYPKMLVEIQKKKFFFANTI